MKKEKRFLDELRNKLKGVNSKNKDAIVLKYENIIKEHKNNNERIIDILKGIGNVDEVAKKEIEEYKKKRSIKYKINNLISKFKKDKSSKKEKVQIKKEKNKKIKKEKSKKESKNLKESTSKFFNKIGKNIKEFFSKFKHKKDKTLKEEVEETIEDAKSEISQVSEIVTEKKIFETKEERNKRIALKTIIVIVTAILLFIWLWITVIFMASLFAFLDGVKFYGLIISIAGLDLLILGIMILINKSLFNRHISRKVSFIFIISCVFVIALGIAIAVKQIYDLNIISDVSEKYNMTKKNTNYNLPKDIDKKLYITFNANYKTEYIIDYDNTISDKINVEVKYYECYYDYFAKKDNNNLYISLRPDKRDRLSVYIDDFKEGKIYDNKELERYVVKITINEKDKDRIVIQ